MPSKNNKEKDNTKETKKEVKKVEEDLFLTKELTNEDLKRIRRRKFIDRIFIKKMYFL